MIELLVKVALPPRLKAPIRRAAKATLEALRRDDDLSVSVISAPEMHRLNLQYRGKDRPTDVLSFEGTRDIVLCWKVAKAQAKEYGSSEAEELMRLTVHGVLHVYGYDHETNEKDARRMFRLQDRILSGLTPGLPRSGSPARPSSRGKSSPRRSSRSRLGK